MMNELEPLDDDVLTLLREAKPIADLEPDAKLAILGAIQARVGLPPTPIGGGDGGGAAGGGGLGSGVQATARSIGARAMGALAASFAVGMATGIAVAPTFTRTEPKSTQIASPEGGPPALTTPRVDAVPMEEPSIAVDSLPSVEPTDASVANVRTASGPASDAPSARGLGAERNLLDVARAALARGEAAEALAAVDRHTQGYRNGVLVEEREALAIKALVALGRRDEARARAEQFANRFPNSLMLRAVNAAAGGP